MRRAWLLAALWAWPVVAAWDGSVQRRRVDTPDGYALALYRYAPPGGGSGRPAVLLVSDVGWGREAFDLEGTGLARFLSSHGRDTYVAELRGQGAAWVSAPWSLTQWTRADLPAIVSAIQQSHAGPVDLVAHGYGGTLALAATTHELEGRVGKVVALSTPALPEVPNPIVREMLAQGGELAGLARDAARFDLVFAEDGRFPPGRLAALRGAAQPLSPAAAQELLAWMEKGDLPLGDGTTVRERLRRYDRPTLFFLPLLDNFAHGEFASALRELAPAAPISVRLLSRFELSGEDYSHLSMLQGSSAPADLWAPALDFLDGPAPPMVAHGSAP